MVSPVLDQVENLLLSFAVQLHSIRQLKLSLTEVAVV